MASSLASTSALVAPSVHQVRHSHEQAEDVLSQVPTSPRSLADQELDSETLITSMSSRVPAVRRRTRTSNASRSSRLSAPLSLTSVIKTGLACLLLVLAVGSEPVKAANVTALTGTWTSGSGKVLTGLDFFNPISKNFTLPTSGGISYSFVEDLPTGGHFETSTFSYTSNSATNRCFTAALTWQHGTFTNNANGSLSLTPYAADGLVQVMDPCAAESTAQYSYSQFELIPTWYSYVETSTGFDNIDGTAYAMQMYDDDGTGAAGTAKNVMYLVSRPPTMLPTEQLFETVLNPTSD